MQKAKFSIINKDEKILELVSKTDKKILAIWAIDCVERVLHYFEEKYPDDVRPRKALEVCRKWVNTGFFKMAEIRKAALDAHAAARDTGEDNSACSAARAAGQAVATSHVPTHSIGAANYCLQAIYRANIISDFETILASERNWQYQHLLELRQNFKI
jgi:hypothetical protein